MRTKVWKEARRVLAIFMAFAMVLTNFSSIPVSADETTEPAAVLNVSDLTVGKIEETQTVNGFTLNATAEKYLEVDANSKSIDGFSFTQRLKLGGTGSTSVRNVAYTATGAATMTVYAISGSSSADRVLALANADGTVESGNAQTALGANISKLTYSIPAAGTYYLYSQSSGINIYYVSVTYEATEEDTQAPENSESGGSTEIPTEWDFRGDDYTGQADYKGLTITGASKHGPQYGMMIKNGSIVVPVAGPRDVVVSVGYNWDISFDDGTVAYFDNTNSGDKDVTYSYTGEKGTVTINVGSQCTSYIKAIKVVEKTVENTETTESTEAPAETPTEWIFTASDFTNGDYANGGSYTYNGLKFTNGKSHNGTYLYSGAGTISVPVKGNCTVTVSACYEYSFYFEKETEASVGVKSGSTSQIDSHSYRYKGEAGYVDITVLGTSYINAIKVEPAAEDVVVVPASVPGKVDVWDLAAEQLDGEKYVNKLSEDIINGWFKGVEAGTEGVNLASFIVEDEDGNVAFGFNDGGYPTTHRLRTKNTNLTRYDQKNKSFGGVDYQGFIYSNKAATNTVYIEMHAKAGDIFTFAVSSNGTEAEYVFESPSGAKVSQIYDAKEAGTLLTFYATETGTYKLYTTKEKLVLCRAYVQHPETITVSGDVTAPESIPAGYAVAFINDKTGAVTKAVVENGKYTAELFDSYSYTVSLIDANGYVITSETALDLPYYNGNSKSFDVTIEGVSLVTVTGSFVGVDKAVVDAMTIEFVSEEIYVPEITIEGTNYTARFEEGVEYAVEISGINDYKLVNPTTVKFTEDGTLDFTIEKKPVYKVSINLVGATADDLAEADFIFTNLKEEGYVYKFKGTSDIQLRDGVYSVVVENSGVFVQQLTSNLTVNGAAVSKTVEFESDITEWNFGDASFTGGKYATNGSYNYQGLEFSNGSNNKTYLLSGAGTIKVPVKGACKVVANVCYQYSFYFEDETEGSVGQKTGSTSQIDTFTYDYTGEAGYVEITVLGTSYFTSISVEEVVPYKEVITVGTTGCDYKTIGEALDAVAGMDRTSTQRVTIEIQPGDYEEMLVIDVPNVTLKNASSTPSIELKNKGVDIDANAVRITSYYGHGYTYYSMGDDCKYDAKILEVNKENGYPSFENPGSGTTAGSYWNATVVVTASGFEAEGIIFENSFNQYVSKKAANDVIVAQTSAKEGSVKRADMKAGDTTVQDKAYVERAAALAIANNVKNVSFDNCKFIGRQDTLYGGTGTTAAFYDCAVYGGTDYIFGGMTAVFAKCDLVFNTSENKNDVGYITAAQTPANTRGLLLYNCTVTSTVPGVDTASEYPSKAGYLGRPWAANTGEAVFYNTIIEATDSYWYEDSASLIKAAGWLSTLSGESVMSAEYGTYEMAKDVDNQSARATWASTLKEPKLADGTEISVKAFLGDWDAFAGKDMTVVIPTDKVDNKPVEDEEVTTVQYVFDATKLTAGADKEVIAEGTTFADGYFKSVGTVTKRTNSDGTVKAIEVDKALKGAIQFTVTATADVVLSMSSTGGSNTSAVALIDNAGNVVANKEGLTTVTGTSETKMTYTGLAAGTYKVVSPENKDYNRGARVFSVVVDEVVTVVTEEYKLDATTLTASADKEAIADGTTFTDGYFKSVGKVTKRTNSDGTVKAIEIDKALTGAIQFTVTGQADVVLSMSSTGGSNTSAVALVDNAGNVVANNEGLTTVTGTSETKMTYTGLAAGTYKVVSPENKDYNRGARLFSLVVEQTASGSRPERADWATVAAPTITSVAVSESNTNQIIVKGTGVIGYDGADSIEVEMLDAKGTVVETQSYGTDSTEYAVTFTPGASGTYTFAVKAIRKDETDKAGVATKELAFVLPLVAPTIEGAFNIGGGDVEVEWNAVKEATSYIVSVEGTEISYTTTELKQVVKGLTVDKTYTIKVTAVRGDESKSATTEITVKDEVEVKWYFSAYGSSTNTKNNGYEVLEDGSVRVYSTGGKGKIVPGSTDGIAYYYTLIDPETTNFTLTATAVVNNWTLSNGQEGFGIMAADRVGTHGDGTAFWNNSYQAIVSKVEYYYDNDLGKVTDDSSYGKVTMKLGVGSLEKIGVTAENLADFNANNTAVINEQFKSTTVALEDSCGKQFGSGTFNLVGNYTGTEPTGTVANTLTEFTFTIQKNNTGYFVTYTDAAGNATTQKYYDTEALSQIVDDSVAIGFFASRNADITFKDITFTTIAPEADAPAEERPVTLVTPSYEIISATISNTAEYELVYYGNADGTLIVKGSSGSLLEKTDVKAYEKVKLNTTLAYGDNGFGIYFKPNEDYVPGEYMELASYDAVGFVHKVNYKVYGQPGDALYVSPTGTANGSGTVGEPLDIYTAVKYAQPGQTIILKEGTYVLRRTVKVERGIDGTAENRINMIADPNAKTRPVLDFQGACAGMVLAGDYWYFQGFDVTNSADAQKGIQVSGNNNVLDQIHTYKNGNTGIQISRYLGSDEYEDWPAHNLILNCTSWENADKGREDADGFAAKLTVGDGNVFDGCVAHHNADDGWDLFAKVQTGSIGSVTIKNSVAYKNGYEFDENGNEILGTGNGNGFKMGGDSMTGGHILENSIAFNNKAKGIDSNSCPDIKVYNSIAFNNGSYNVAFYTNTAANTDYEASGIISYRTEKLDQAEQLKLVGTQDQNKVYGDTNYYWDATKQVSANKAGEEVKADWFKSLEFTGITRNEDGTINMNGFLELTENAKVDASIGGTGSTEVKPGDSTDGTINGVMKPSTTPSDDEEEDDNIIKDIVDTIVGAITGGNKDKDKDKEKEEVKVPEGTDELVKDLVADILSGESVGTAVSEETAEKIAEAIKEGKTIVTETVTTVLEESQVPAEEKEAIEAFVSSVAEKECGIAQYLDLSVLIGTTEGDTLGNYHETAQSIAFTVEIPSDMIAEGRTFFVVRIHNGEAEALETKDNGDGTITFKTNKFSTYAIAYIDGEVENLPVVEDNVPVVEQPVVDDVVVEESSNMGMLAVIAVLLLAVGSFLIIKRKKDSEQDKLN